MVVGMSVELWVGVTGDGRIIIPSEGVNHTVEQFYYNRHPLVYHHSQWIKAPKSHRVNIISLFN